MKKGEQIRVVGNAIMICEDGKLIGIKAKEDVVKKLEQGVKDERKI